jgi:L-seryl-tRNA(Ser) seleniumtransferase
MSKVKNRPSKAPPSALAQLPSVDVLLQHPLVEELLARYDREFALSRLRRQVDRMREELRRGTREATNREVLTEEVAKATVGDIHRLAQPSLRRAINATGIILHTGLGRAPLPVAARERVAEAIVGYSTLEIDLETGQRGDRTRHVE